MKVRGRWNGVFRAFVEIVVRKIVHNFGVNVYNRVIVEGSRLDFGTIFEHNYSVFKLIVNPESCYDRPCGKQQPGGPAPL